MQVFHAILAELPELPNREKPYYVSGVCVSISLLPFQVHKALRLDRTKNQWVDLGVLSMACITVPDTCRPEGAAVSFWIKTIDCPGYGGLISSTAIGQKKGIDLICLNNKIR